MPAKLFFEIFSAKVNDILLFLHIFNIIINIRAAEKKRNLIFLKFQYVG